MGNPEVSDVSIAVGDPPGGLGDAEAAAAVKPAAAARPGLCKRVLRYALEQWFILGLGVVIGFAAAVPRLGATGGWLRAEYSIKLPAIVLIFVISGLGLKTKALLGAAGDVRLHALVQGLSLGALPALGAAVAAGLRSAGFNPPLCDGLVIMASMPTTVSTNVVYTARAAGNEPAALVNAVLGNILGIFITPLWLQHFLDVSGAAPYAAVLVELSYTIIAPLLVGQALQYGAPRAVAWIKAHINTANVSSACILALVWLTFCNTFSNGAARKVPGGDVAAMVALNVALFAAFAALSFLVAWPPPPLRWVRRLLRVRRPDAVAVVICGSTKTVALGVPLINVMYGNVPTAGLLAMPLIIYHALQVLLGGLLIAPLRAWCLAAPPPAAEEGEHAGAARGAASASSRRWSLMALLLPGGRSSQADLGPRPGPRPGHHQGHQEQQHQEQQPQHHQEQQPQHHHQEQPAALPR
ncbi:RCH1 [Scenedesmus sp. PABB004]|nr:RCH1 [Scenedesmus sp. PABB004]